MLHLFKEKITFIWLLLILATGMSWQFGHGFGFGEQYQYGTMAVLIVTMIKVRFVYLDFMELRNAPKALRLTIEGWAVLIGTILIVLYLRST